MQKFDLYCNNPCFSAKEIKLSSIFYATFFIVVSIFALTEKYSYLALILIFIIGCSSSLFKFVARIFGLCSSSSQKVDYSKINKKDLPIYTILLPAFKESAVRRCLQTQELANLVSIIVVILKKILVSEV